MLNFCKQKFINIAVKQEEAFQDGMEKGLTVGRAEGLSQGISKGTEQKALEDALLLIKKYGVAPETAAEDMKVPLEKVLELQN